MIFPALHRFALSRGLLDDPDFTAQVIGSRAHITNEGAFVGFFSVGDKKAPIKKLVSLTSARTASAVACLGADNAKRIIPGLSPEEKERDRETQKLFLGLLKELSAAADHTGVSAVVTFLDRIHASESFRATVVAAFNEQKLRDVDWLTFSVEGMDGFLIEWPKVMNWWRQKRSAAREEILSANQGKLVPCMVTGKLCVPVETHRARIKVVPQKKQQDVALVSADSKAFQSYGFEKALVSPMSVEAVEGYIRAINYLGDKAHPDHHHRTADTIFLFWCDRPEVSANPAKAIEEGDDVDWLSAAIDQSAPVVPLSDSPIAAKKTFGSVDAGALSSGADAAAARFYCLALSGSSARGVIRGWIDQPLPAAVEHVKEWFADLTIPLDRPLLDPTDKPKDPKKRCHLSEIGDNYNKWRLSETFGHSGILWSRLCLVSALEGKGDSGPELARYRTQLFSCALLGRAQPVPLELLAVATRRIATTGDCPPHRAALIQFLLRRHYFQQPELNLITMSVIDQTIQKSQAFRSGRLLRVLQGIQSKALGDRNASVIDKFYSSASATPAAVLGGLVAKAQPHLSKIRKDSPGLAHWFDEQLTEIVGGIVEQGGFKATHDPAEQGEFALGFYYQRLLARKQKPEADDPTDGEAAE